MRRLSWLAVGAAALLAGCARAELAPATAARPRVELLAETRSEPGQVVVSYRLRNGDARPVMFRAQPEPFVVTGPGGAVEISVGRVAIPPDGHPNLPAPTVPMRVLAPGDAVELAARVPTPPVDRPPLFPRTRAAAMVGWSFCVGVSYLTAAGPTTADSKATAVGFADEDYFCVPLATP